MYDLKDHKILVTRSVTFVESDFPCGENYEKHKTIVNEHLVDALDDMHIDDGNSAYRPDENPLGDNSMPLSTSQD